MSSDLSKYPEDNPFSLKQNHTTYTYTIISERFYPPDIVRYTSAHSRNGTKYKIPDNYLVQTKWGREKSRHVVECEIEYDINEPKKNPNTQAKLSGVHVFGLNAIDVEREREKKKRSHSLKPFAMLSESMKTKRSRAFSMHVGTVFNNETPKFYNPVDQPVLQELRFNVQNKGYVVNFHQNIEKNNQHIEAITKIIDQSPISRDAYRNLAALQYELPRDHMILNARKKINKEMSQQIPISILNITDIPIPLIATNEPSDIDNQEVEEEMHKYIGKAGYRRITDILLFLIPDLVNRKVLSTNSPVIHIRISGDGRNVGRKIKHVMMTCSVLDDVSNLYSADYHHTILLCPGTENYNLFKKIMAPLVDELDNLVKNGLVDSMGIRWQIKPYFSSDWKFLCIVLGFNAPNTTYFCPWCLCTKRDIGTQDKVYTIEKSMEQLKAAKPSPGHTKPPLIPMISLDHYVPDELHVMLRIWDRLWSLVIQELKSESRYDEYNRGVIIREMERISVKFQFWQEHNTESWSYTSLMGDDKEKVLHSFNFEVIFDKERAILINHLWRDFYALYKLMKQPGADPSFFAGQAKKWLYLFLTPHEALNVVTIILMLILQYATDGNSRDYLKAKQKDVYTITGLRWKLSLVKYLHSKDIIHRDLE
ncbi:6082_t:CDS:2 [Cetraspora pellucida]|uniref:6082_t:CDS:1 n=1 Tax=Cetraspora pellucida TaxID=1433469 RepID=A0A9N9CGE4_9GLOM|nr:6082_t:CDS:2 [Cetraspora pellucida]